MAKKIREFQFSCLAVLLLVGVALVVSSQTQLAWAANVNYKITTIIDSHSTISPINVTLNNGTSQSFIFSASGGYSISQVLINGSAVSISSPYTYTNIQNN